MSATGQRIRIGELRAAIAEKLSRDGLGERINSERPEKPRDFWRASIFESRVSLKEMLTIGTMNVINNSYIN